MHTIRKYLLLLLSVLTGAVFLYSAYTKLIPIQAFEYTLVDDAHLPRMFAAIVARLFIALEAGLGASILLHFFGSGKWVLKTAFLLITVFSIYLIYLWAAKGNNVNCGCFGDTIWMSPATSLIKNVFILLVLALLIRYHKGFNYNWAKTIPFFLLAAAMIVIFIVFPVFKPYKMDFTAIYAGQDVPSIDLRKGKHIIGFLNPSCTHCRKTALKMHNDLKADTTLPFFMIIGGLTSDLTQFWKTSEAQGIPYIRLDSDPFIRYTHNVTPYIIWINNGWVEEETDYNDLSTPAIEKWMQH